MELEHIASAAEASWEKELKKVIIQGTGLQKKIFYTALYHTMVQPNTMSDVNGEYMAADYTTRKVAIMKFIIPLFLYGIHSEQLIRFILCCIPTAFLILLKA